jgi:tetraacyldisaccharide 4'-kinase
LLHCPPPRAPRWLRGSDRVLKQRTRAAATASRDAGHPVADDGLQHLALERDVEICVFDERGLGNGWLLPAGLLREPWPRTAELVLQPVGAAVRPAGFEVRRRLASHALRADGSPVPLPALAAQARSTGAAKAMLWAIAGIAHPERFFGMLRDQGLPLAGTRSLPDHAPPEAFDWPEAREGILLCTEKDAPKLRAWRPDALAVPLELWLDPAFWTALRALLPRPNAPAPGTAPKL